MRIHCLRSLFCREPPKAGRERRTGVRRGSSPLSPGGGTPEAGGGGSRRGDGGPRGKGRVSPESDREGGGVPRTKKEREPPRGGGGVPRRGGDDRRRGDSERAKKNNVRRNAAPLFAIVERDLRSFPFARRKHHDPGDGAKDGWGGGVLRPFASEFSPLSSIVAPSDVLRRTALASSISLLAATAQDRSVHCDDALKQRLFLLYTDAEAFSLS